jgi:hypothetical protein
MIVFQKIESGKGGRRRRKKGRRFVHQLTERNASFMKIKIRFFMWLRAKS